MRATHQLLQWNMGCTTAGKGTDSGVITRRINLLEKLVAHYRPELIAIQEAPEMARNTLIKSGYKTEFQSKRQLLSAFLTRAWSPSGSGVPFVANTRMIGMDLQYTGGSTQLSFWNIHLSSRLHADDTKRQREVTEIAVLVAGRAATATGLTEHIIAGDFNMDPFENALDSLRTNRSQYYVLSKTAAATPDKPWFFNPTWALLTSDGPIHGSFFYNGTGSGPWYVFDQVLLTSGVLPPTPGPAVAELVTAVSGVSLHTPRSLVPDRNVGSDHFPVVSQLHVI